MAPKANTSKTPWQDSLESEFPQIQNVCFM